MPEKFTPEEVAKFTESRTLRDAEFFRGGSHYEISEGTDPILRLTPRQKGSLKKVDSEPQRKREKKERTKVIRTFSIPDQTEQLDFKAYLDQRLLFGSYVRYVGDENSPFEEMVYKTSKPFEGIKGAQFEEITVKVKSGERAVKAERNIKPISLNEWRYLFSQLTEKDLLGDLYYYVQFDDGVVRSIHSSMDQSGGGPYGYSVEIRKLSPHDYTWFSVIPRIICPA